MYLKAAGLVLKNNIVIHVITEMFNLTHCPLEDVGVI